MLNVMEDFEFLRRVDLEEAKELCPQGESKDEFVTPYNYMEIFKPKSAAELRKIIGAAPPVGAEDTPRSRSQSSDEPKGERKEAKSLKDLI